VHGDAVEGGVADFYARRVAMTAVPQHMQALAAANEIRMAIADFKRDTRLLGTRGAALRVADVLDGDHDAPEQIRVQHLLSCIPRVGQGKVGTLMHTAGVGSWTKRLGDLTPRQRRVLALQLRLWVEGWQSNTVRASANARRAGR
jgi:hypothetical protein